LMGGNPSFSNFVCFAGISISKKNEKKWERKKKVNRGKAGRKEQEIEEDYDYGENMELTSMLSGAPPEMVEFDQNDQ